MEKKMCLGIKWNNGPFMNTCESYFDPIEEKKMFCIKYEAAVDGVVPFCSFCACKIYTNCNEHRPSTDDEKEIIYYFMKGYMQIRSDSFVF